MNRRGDSRSPLYARVLRLKHIHPGGLMCFLFFEGAILLAILLTLAELVNWLSVLVLPAIVAGLVKINDVVAGAFARIPVSDSTIRFTTRRRLGEARGMAAVPRRPDPEADLQAQALPPGIPGSAGRPELEPPTRAERRRALDQRRFAPATSTEIEKKSW